MELNYIGLKILDPFKLHIPCLFSFFVLFIGIVKFTRKTYAQSGWRTYRRPDEKSGGHGVGWSPIIPYAFSVPQDWEEVIIYNQNLRLNCLFELAFESHIQVVLFLESLPLIFGLPFRIAMDSSIQSVYQVPVSIADLGGTEIDLRFASSKEGRIFVIVAPVLRFADG